MLNIQDLHVSVAEKEILHGISIKIQPGELHVLMGPNGSGKSTLAYTIAGHPSYTVTSGSAHLENPDNTDLLALTPDERSRAGVFLAFQYPVGVSGLSVYNLLRAAWEAKYGAVKSVLEFRKMVQEVAGTIDVKESLLSRNINEDFSGGEKKRIELLQMMILKPLYAILDETDSGLDTDAIKIVAQGIQLAVTEHKMGVLLITHYQRILRYLKPNAVHVMVKGEIVLQGGPELAEQIEKDGFKKLEK